MTSVVNVIARITLIFFFLSQIVCNFQFLLAQIIVFDIGVIWDLSTIYYQAYIFHKLQSQDLLDFLL